MRWIKLTSNLEWISVKVTPAFKERLKQKSIADDPLGRGNLSDTVRKACQAYVAGNSFGNEDMIFLYNLLENKFKLKIELTDIEKRKLQKIEGDINRG